MPSGSRRSRLLGGSDTGSRGVLVSIISTLLFIVLVGFLIVNAPGWEEFQSFFFDPEIFASSWPKIVRAFWINVQMFLVAEVFVLIFGLLPALMRSLPGPVFTPIRGLAIVYVDVMRGLPAILVVYILGFGMPGLGIEGMPSDEFFWGTLSLVLLYSAYVSEVYRAGIDSVHPSQEAAARSLGLSRFHALRYVVVPQAVRRVIPPLLNDFIGLQKDTALVGLLGLVEAFRRADIEAAAAFNFTPYVVTALLFLALTIPLSRFVDWLVVRDQRRQLAGVR
ncbi:MAG TPA: amino acid ABC transporter permease [Candidatus Deferrimicrobium sp.]|nr:amino acid ABC transporter permease [Candidatus Deferrimicrobium sp.]